MEPRSHLQSPILATIVAAALATLGAACTDAGLEPARGPGNTIFDDELRLTGRVCSSPAADELFPVKVLFIVDTSDSMSVTDRGAIRAAAVDQVIGRFAGNPAVKFGVIAFDSNIDDLTQGFVNSPDRGAIAQRLSQADRLTDYQGALGAAYKLLAQDMANASPAERARSKYVLIFFSDGTPDPQCSSRPTPCGAGECPAHQHCRAQTCKDDYLICTVPRREWETAFNPPLSPDLYPDLGAGADYNQPDQILRAVDDIIGLQEFYHAGEIRLHTAFLYDPEAASDPLAIPFGLDHDGGVQVMTDIAQRGLGTFTEFDSASKIDFLSINYNSFREQYSIVGLIANNLNAIDTGAEQLPDSDGDGLLDRDEMGQTCAAAAPICTDPTDSDGDGYTDLVEERYRASGFDPKDPKKPLSPCSSKDDTDNDGLRDCEEAFFKTDPRTPDTDGDRIPDGLEVRAGLDPANRDDAFGDLDRDGVRNLDEIVYHTNPKLAPPQGKEPTRYLYEVAQTQTESDTYCYDFDIRHIKLVTTLGNASGRTGVNRVMLSFDEAPQGLASDPGNFRLACVDVRYVEGLVKSPWSGLVTLQDTDFKPAANFNPSHDCIDDTKDTVVPDGAEITSGSP